MTAEPDWAATLSEIIGQMTEAGVTELEVRHGDLRVRLRRAISVSSRPAEAGQATTGGNAGLDGEEGPEPHRVLAPLTGIYYAAPNPSARPYVEIGDWVEDDTVVALIETMKVFNEVTAECHGRVVGIVADQGQLVQAGDMLVLVDTLAVPDPATEVRQ